MFGILIGTLIAGYGAALARCLSAEVENNLWNEEWEMAMYKEAIYESLGYPTIVKSKGRATIFYL